MRSQFPPKIRLVTSAATKFEHFINLPECLRETLKALSPSTPNRQPRTENETDH